jgi:hypothetical protein
MDEFGGDIDKALPAYTAARLEDVHALFRLDQDAADRLGFKGKRMRNLSVCSCGLGVDVFSARAC